MTECNPLITLNNGVKMPALGFGVFLIDPKETSDPVEIALAQGYRLIDTAAAYLNEEQVGQGIRSSGVDRSEIFVTTKLWLTDYGYDQTLHACDRSLRKLGLDYLDLYLLHWPLPSDFEATAASYQAAEKLLADGCVRAIGVCNFSEKHLDALMERTEVLPAVNQVQLHPFFTQKGLRDAHERLGIVTQAWSPIGGINRYWDNPAEIQDPLAHPVVVECAEKYGKTPAQVVLRWQIQNGISAIPKSVNAGRIAENFDIFDFELTAADMTAIEALDSGLYAGPDPELLDRNTFDIKIED
jgi:diketogulonate reductase-like aldo/keto reductase